MSLPTNFFIGRGGGEPPLYDFTTHTFTNGTATGRYGPTLSDVRSQYSGASWAQDNAYLNMVIQLIQHIVVVIRM